jgi:hypothetical protein
MTQFQRKSINELLEMSSAEVREYLQTLSAAEQKTTSAELYRAMLRANIQKLESLKDNSQNKSQ